MTSMQNAIAAATASMKTFAGLSVEYRRGSSSTVRTAGLSRLEYDVTDSYGVTETVSSDDFLIDPGDLRVGADEVLPIAGDCIVIIDGGYERTFEVMSRDGLPCYVWSDPHRTRLRVHTRLTGESET